MIRFIHIININTKLQPITVLVFPFFKKKRKTFSSTSNEISDLIRKKKNSCACNVDKIKPEVKVEGNEH